ncbi:methyltransferase domain-containing protein [Thermodesulfobacteriota bacterium]
MRCRFCDNELKYEFIDLVNAPPSNAYLTQEQLNKPETYFPLKIFFCEKCWLVQLDEHKKYDEIFNQDYAYFSSFSKSWLKHSEKYVNMIAEKLCLSSHSLVIEIASNDGYLLQYFIPKDIPCLGIEPTAGTAKAARERGIETIQDFFSVKLAKALVADNRKADLVLGNNVLAHVPDINDFVEGIKIVLKHTGTSTFEFPHLLNLIRQNQFDTIYHEHFSYLSLTTVRKIFADHGLDIYDVEEIQTHGGSLRIYAKHSENNTIPVSENVLSLEKRELENGICDMRLYQSFQRKADKVKYDFLEFLLKQKKTNKKIAAYGAAAKGNTLLNYCGIKNDLIDFVADASTYKQNKYLPGSHVPIVTEAKIREAQPDFVIIFPWNIKEEIMEQLDYIREWNGKFVIAIPELNIL